MKSYLNCSLISAVTLKPKTVLYKSLKKIKYIYNKPYFKKKYKHVKKQEYMTHSQEKYQSMELDS